MRNISRHIKGVVLIFIVFFITKCVSIIDFDVASSERELVIYGKLTNAQNYDQGITVQWSDLNTTADLSIADATVVVEDENDHVFPYVYSVATEKYLPVNPLVGIPGTAYRARVTVNDETYISSFQRMPTIGAQDSSYFEIDRVRAISNIGVLFERFVLRVYTDSRLDASDSSIYMKWDVERVDLQQEMLLPGSNFPFYSPRNCYNIERYSGQEILLFDGDLVNTLFIQGQKTLEIPLENSLSTLRGIGIIQSSISREAMEYWRKVNDVSNRTGNIFEIPPAPIPGNISLVSNPNEKVLGFFEVAKMDTSGTEITRADFPVIFAFGGNTVNCSNFATSQFNSIPANCFPCLGDRGVPEVCYNCLSKPNSTLTKPSYLD
ncbi:MAG: hypothetical protein R8G66_17835 [Cytophagales bacterium]|nr:hypothetical protein [Cytophagales bacterium]